jgi:hypothetical protein
MVYWKSNTVCESRLVPVILAVITPLPMSTWARWSRSCRGPAVDSSSSDGASWSGSLPSVSSSRLSDWRSSSSESSARSLSEPSCSLSSAIKLVLLFTSMIMVTVCLSKALIQLVFQCSAVVTYEYCLSVSASYFSVM